MGKVQVSEMDLSLERRVADGDFPQIYERLCSPPALSRPELTELCRLNRGGIVQNSQPGSIVRVNAPAAVS